MRNSEAVSAKPVDVRRVTVATVVDARAPYTDEVDYLFSSMAMFGGALAGARRRAYFVERVLPRTERRLSELGVDVRVVAEVEPRFRLANKLAMLDAESREDTEVLIALDTDVVVAGDVTPYLESALLQAKQPDGDLLGLDTWARLFEHFGLALPVERYATSLEGSLTHAYFNTGVLIVPGHVLRAVHERWLHFIRALIDTPAELCERFAPLQEKVPRNHGAICDELEHLYFAEQWAFSLARHELAIPYAVLPLALNFPTMYSPEHHAGQYICDRFTPDAVTPLLIHHHHHVQDGLRLTGYTRPDEVIAAVNHALFRQSARRYRA